MDHPKRALKFDNNKPSIGLIPNKALTQIAEVFDFGASKYGRHNFREGLKYSRLIDAAYRHLGAFNDGEDIDPESGKSHIAHLGCCVMMLLTYLKEHPELDDRYGKKQENRDRTTERREQDIEVSHPFTSTGDQTDSQIREVTTGVMGQARRAGLLPDYSE